MRCPIKTTLVVSRMQDQKTDNRGMLCKAWRKHSERMMRSTEERQGKLLKCPS